MRPKRTVLVHSPCAATCGQLRLVLQTRGHAARAVASAEELLPLARSADVCLLVGLLERDRLALETALHAASPGCALIAVAPPSQQDSNLWTADLLEKIKLACRRKRGPKPRPGTPPLPVLAAEIQRSLAPPVAAKTPPWSPDYRRARQSAAGAAAHSAAIQRKYFPQGKEFIA